MAEIDRDKTHLFPPFAQLLVDFEAGLAAASLPFYLFEGLRSWARQEYLYAQGRTRPGVIVTNAKPGQSFHFYGMAADYVLDGISDKPGIQWSWDMRDQKSWKAMADLAVSIGLEAALYWKTFPECPHVQHRFGLTILAAQDLYRHGGLETVWQAATNWIEQQQWP